VVVRAYNGDDDSVEGAFKNIIIKVCQETLHLEGPEDNPPIG
jgi:hypothetical protein